jgi:hypothetical protein
MKAFELVKIAKPLFSPLSDEHARIGINLDNSYLRDAKVFLPCSLIWVCWYWGGFDLSAEPIE